MNRNVPNPAAARMQQQLFVGRSLDFASIADQPLTRVFAGTSYRITDIVVVQRSGSGLTACLGGIYDGANKTGNAIVSALQAWLSLGAGKIVTPALAALTTTNVLSANLILSLTTANGAALTADVFVFGYVID